MNLIQRLGALALLLALAAGTGAAQAAPPVRQAAPPNTYTFAQMGFDPQTLTSPRESQQFAVTLPSAWKIESGSAILLNIDLANLQPLPSDAAALGRLQLNLNGSSLGAFELTKLGKQQISVRIPETALAAATDTRLALNVSLIADLPIQLLIQDDSTFTLLHSVAALPTSLSDLPAPLYEGSFIPDTALIVLPDAPSAQELRAALIVAAGLGRMTGNQLGLTVQRSGDLTNEAYSAAHLIFVGKPDDMPLLRTVKLPAAATAAGFTSPSMGADDGVVQLAASPWNDEKAVLVVGGNSDAAVLKAAQAFAADQLLTLSSPSLALIAAIQPELSQEEPPPVRTFEYLGYESPLRVSRVGQSTTTVSFDVPRDRRADEESTLTLYFNHSALLDYAQSGITLLLNSTEIGGVAFSTESTSLSNVTMTIPPSLVRAGVNRLTARVTLASAAPGVSGGDLWVNLWPNSFITMPLTPTSPGPTRSVNMDLYPDIFAADPSLADMAFVLAPDDPASWGVAAQIAADLGARVTGLPTDLEVAYGDAVSSELRDQRNLLIVGIPNRIALIEELKDALPAPFDLSTNQAINRDTQVVFRTAAGADVGYAELLRAPWAPRRLILTILGSSPQGLAYASNVFNQPDLRGRLGGTFATIVGDQIFIGGSRLANLPDSSASAAPAPTAAPAEPALVESPFPAATAPKGPPSMLIPLALSVLLIALVVAGVVGRTWLARRFRRRAASQ